MYTSYDNIHMLTNIVGLPTKKIDMAKNNSGNLSNIPKVNAVNKSF